MLCGECRAGTVSPSDVSIDIDGWTMTPLVEDNAGNKTVLGFVCFKDMTLAAGNNLVSVWFIRGDGTSGPDGWKAKAWTSQDQWEAIAWLKNELAIEGEADDLWGTKSAKPAQLSQTPPAPSQYGGGVLEEDPVYPLIQGMANPGAVIQGLVSIGYPAADIKLETTFDPGCPFESIFEALSLGVEAEVLSGGQTPGVGIEVAQAAAVQRCSNPNNIWFCFPQTWTSPASPWSPWSSASSWTLMGVQNQLASNACCKWCKTRTRTRTQVLSHVYRNCDIGTCTQTETQTEWECACCAAPMFALQDCINLGVQCLGSLANSPLFAPNEPTTSSGWQPACNW